MENSTKIRNNAFNILEENYNNSNTELTLPEWVKNESQNDPTFYSWILPDADNIGDFGTGMTFDQIDAVDQFISGFEEVQNIRDNYEL